MLSPQRNRCLERLRYFWRWDILRETGGVLYLRSVNSQSLCPFFLPLWDICWGDLWMIPGSPIWVSTGWEFYRPQLLVLLATAEWGGPPCTSGWVVTLLLSLNGVTVECGGQPGPWAHQLSLSLNSGDAPVVGSLWDHKLTVRVDGMGLTLKPTNALLWLLINETSVGPAGHLPGVWQHHWGPTWVSVPNAYALICRQPSQKVHLVKEDFFAFNWELVPSEPKGCG